MDDRARPLLADLPTTAKVVEIGPRYKPLASRRDGWNTTVIDHETRDGLVAKNRDHPFVDVSRIEEVDFVGHGAYLTDLVGPAESGSFTAFIASHVIEHTTDVVRLLQAARSPVKDEGVVILAVPDKCLCSDFFRPISTTGDAIVAFREKRQRHSAKTLRLRHVPMPPRRGAGMGAGLQKRSIADLPQRERPRFHGQGRDAGLRRRPCLDVHAV